MQAALSAPVRLTLGPTRWRLPRWKIAPILDLPDHGSTTLGLGGPGEQKWFKRLAGTVDREPRDATWAVGEHIRVIPDRPGVLIERKATEQAVLSALLSSDNRLAKISVTSLAPSRTTKQAKGMGIVGLVGSYETIYGGDANRINNVQLVSHLIDGTLVGPGATFSFNGTTGERTEEKGFKEAPVIINGELGTGIAGGVCQVSTTVFNAAYEGGLEITERHNHALYISHYPTGRDATVNYPDLDLKFVNDTSRWLLLRTFVGSDSLVVNLYGTPVDRRVVTETSPLKVAGPVPVERVDDPDNFKGHNYVEESGVPPQEVSVHRTVYSATGTLLHDDTWDSYYEGEKRVIKVGTKEPPPPPTETTPTETETTPTPRRRPRRRRLLRRRRPTGRRLRPLQLILEPVGHAGRPQRAGVHARVLRPAVGDRLAASLDHVVEAEARAADVAAAHPDHQLVVEGGRRAIPDVRLESSSPRSPCP